MSTRALTIRSTVRRALAAGIFVFAWFAASQVAAGTPGAWALGLAAAALLIVLLAAIAHTTR